MSNVLYVGGVDVEEVLGVSVDVSDVDGWAAGMSYEREVVMLPGQLQGIQAPLPAYSPRQVRISFSVRPDSVATRDTLITSLSELFPPNMLLELRFGDSPEKVLEGTVIAESMSATSAHPFAISNVVYSVTIQCANPSKRDRVAQSVAFGSTATDVPTGTLPSEYELQISGSATDPVVTLYDADGSEVGSMTFTVTLGADEYLSIDSQNKTIKKYTAGVASNAIATWTDGDFFTLDPNDGNYSAAAWPSIQVSSGSGLLLYYRRYRV